MISIHDAHQNRYQLRCEGALKGMEETASSRAEATRNY